ncbi:MAG: bifunctional phosphoglucose/phosphomannose isomerase [Candidatus Liptonbacteria bacterium]|nr:bifunctional phosphoglucose/phosphomannose isomerase [Candidatus Liptonbacteria bacterium]
MNMYNAIKTFNTQFGFEPKIENLNNLQRREKFVVAGMGGSHLAADLFSIINPELDIEIHKDYGLPALPDLKNRFLIASSYSGNTEETVSAFLEARKHKIPVAAIAVGGKLMELAKKFKVPYVQLPDLQIQPRSALGVSIMAMFALMNDRRLLKEASHLKSRLRPDKIEAVGKALAYRIKGKVPVVYSSSENAPIAYNWKIKLNETGKIPAFMNVLPELNHNEMNGFDVHPSTRPLSRVFHFLLLKDKNDNEHVQKRMEVLASLYEARKLPVMTLELKGKTVLEKIFSSLLLADWLAYHTATLYKVDPEQVPLVEEFKKLIAKR